MKRILTAAALLGVLAVAGCSESPSTPAPASEAGPWSEQMPGDSGYDGYLGVDPLTSTGIWKVPADIAPGRYAVTDGAGAVTSLRWVQACSDPYCEQPIDESTTYAPEGPGQKYIVIPADAQAVNNTGVVLTKVE